MTEYDPELVERMVTHLRGVVERYGHVKEGGGAYNQDLAEARAIVAELPVPVDPDLLIARQVAAADSLYADSDVARQFVSGNHDDSHPVRIVLAAIKRVRQEQAKPPRQTTWQEEH